MSLGDIAEGLEVTSEQKDLGIATVDRTEVPLAARLKPHTGELPCTAETAASIVDAYASGAVIGEAARDADVAPMVAAKTLHRLGETVSVLESADRQPIRDWIAGDLSRAEARTRTRSTPAEFALAAYVETHEPIPAARAAVEGCLTRARETAHGADALADSRDGPEGLR